jgi:hypothetical protein
MKQSHFFEQACFAASLLTLALFTGGTKACQEDYELGSQISVTPSATPTGTADDDDDGVITRTPTVTATPTGTVTSTTTATPTGTTGTAASLLQAFRSAANGGGAPSERPTPKPAPIPGNAASTSSSARSGSDPVSNWLGAFGADSEEFDTDRDGFSDALEVESGTAADDENDTPPGPITKLRERIREVGAVANIGDDSDQDGLADLFEVFIGSNPEQKDSDSDGILDGKEVELGGDPIIAEPR